MNSGNSKMAKEALVFLPAKLAEGIITMATTILYADFFTTAANGLFQMIHTNVLFINLIAFGWLLNSAVRYVNGWKDDDGRKKYFSTVCICFLAIMLLSLSAGTFMTFAAGDKTYLAGAFMLCAYALFQTLNAVLIQCGKIRASVLLSLLSAAAKLLSAIAIAQIIPNGMASPYPPVFAAIISDLIAGICAFSVLKIKKSFSFSAFSRPDFVTFAKFGVPLVGFSISSALLNMADRYIVDFLCGTEVFAVYSSNNSISTGIFSLLMAGVMRGVYPNVLKSWRDGGKTAALPMINGGVRLYLLIALPAAIGLAAVGSRLSQVLFAKNEYHIGIIISIMAVSMFFLGLTEYVNKAWELTSNTVPILINGIISAVIKIAATFAFITAFGIPGAALGSLAAYFCYFLISYIRARKTFVFHLPFLNFARIFTAAILCGAAAFAVLSFTSGILSLILSIVCGATVYSAVLIFSGEVKEELAAISGHFRKK